MIAGFIWIRVSIDAVGVENFGTFIAVSTFAGFLSLAEGGTGAGLRFRLSEIAGEADQTKRKLIASAYFQLLLFTLASTIALIAIITFSPWIAAIGLSRSSNPYALQMLAIVSIVGAALALLLSNVFAIAAATNWQSLQSIGSALGLVVSCVVLSIYDKTHGSLSIVTLSVIWFGSSIFSSLLLNIFYFSCRKSLIPKLADIGLVFSKTLLTLGAKLFLINISVYFIFTITNLFVSRVSGTEAVTEVAIATRLFGVVQTIGGTWAFFSLSHLINARVLENIEWIRRFIKLTLLIALALGAATILIGLVAPTVFSIWLGGSDVCRPSILWMQALITIICLWNNVFSVGQISTGKLKSSLYCASAGMVINLTLAQPLGEALGAPGVQLSVIIAILPSAIVLPVVFFKSLRQINIPIV